MKYGVDLCKFDLCSFSVFLLEDPNMTIALVKMFSWWFLANKRLTIMSIVLKLCDVMDDVMT